MHTPGQWCVSGAADEAQPLPYRWVGEPAQYGAKEARGRIIRFAPGNRGRPGSQRRQLVVPRGGFEPPRPCGPADFKPGVPVLYRYVPGYTAVFNGNSTVIKRPVPQGIPATTFIYLAQRRKQPPVRFREAGSGGTKERDTSTISGRRDSRISVWHFVQMLTGSLAKAAIWSSFRAGSFRGSIRGKHMMRCARSCNLPCHERGTLVRQ
jgi:hypothetical protein